MSRLLQSFREIFPKWLISQYKSMYQHNGTVLQEDNTILRVEAGGGAGVVLTNKLKTLWEAVN